MKSSAKNDSPLRVQTPSKEYVKLTAEEMFGNRHWVLDKNGRLVERYGYTGTS